MAKNQVGVAITFGSENKIREVFEAARQNFMTRFELRVFDSRNKLIAVWNQESGWRFEAKKPVRRGPAMFIAPFRLNIKSSSKEFDFPRAGNETFVVAYERKPKTKR